MIDSAIIRSDIQGRSALARDETADLVAHHSGVNDCRCIFIRTFLAGICLEAKIALPEVARFSIDGGDFKRVTAIGDSLYAVGSFDGLQLGNAALHAGHPVHWRLSSSWIIQIPGLLFR
jgi:hypothetical protein